MAVRARVVAAVKCDLAKLTPALEQSGMAAAALALARRIDSPKTSATATSMCARALSETLAELRALMPPEEENDGVDEIAERRATRREGAAGT